MIRPALIFVSAATILCLVACDSDQDQKPHPHHSFGYNGDQTVVGPGAESDATPPPAPGVPTENTGPIAPPPPPPPTPPDQGTFDNANGTGTPGSTPNTPGPNGPGAPPKQHDYPYAQPVPGKPGFVTSPYAPYSGYVDVRGFPPGTEVKDPYTQKIFLVP